MFPALEETVLSESFGENRSDTLVEERVRPPRDYKVIMHNDDYTSMDFVVAVLMKVFRKSQETAVELMLAIHHEGKAVCGVYPREIAEIKIAQVAELARAAEFPLKCTMEEV
ncbi:ATP-dependent Clp protease adaptor protein ClpS [Desulfobaculum bizertense DSM 18034]|uniref:ATP-dependent Clp protease adapter protein ClpS n=1 Tax=Desulfobaculum bizertense DSM 18034 TaxID=1121442 RepID=A0A1T4WWC5_9BACT|nr:ATP-dependent Clp protease adaptor protein ClpS [Desulfobaculum bizertense DSM 18034]